METEAVKEVFNLGLGCAVPRRVGPEVGEVSAPYLVVPPNCKVEGLEALLARPSRKRGVARLSDVESFCEFVKRYLTPETVLCIEEAPALKFVAIFDAHEPGAAGRPGWCQHRAEFAPVVAPEWQRWVAAAGKTFTQAEFAEFLEDRVLDVVKPEGAEILEMVLSLTAKAEVSYRSAMNLQNGSVQLVYEEETKAGAAEKGMLELPRVLRLGLPVFVGGPRFELEVKLRYRLRDRALVFAYEIPRQAELVKIAQATMVDGVAAGTGLRPFLGSM